jgi:hypothetical protein
MMSHAHWILEMSESKSDETHRKKKKKIKNGLISRKTSIRFVQLYEHKSSNNSVKMYNYVNINHKTTRSKYTGYQDPKPNLTSTATISQHLKINPKSSPQGD